MDISLHTPFILGSVHFNNLIKPFVTRFLSADWKTSLCYVEQADFRKEKGIALAAVTDNCDHDLL